MLVFMGFCLGLVITKRNCRIIEKKNEKMKTYTFVFEYSIKIDAENEEDAIKQLDERLDAMDFDEIQEFVNPDCWELE